MSIVLVLHTAFAALRRNRLRTLLTMLGMIIGVASVITIVGLGAGAHQMIEDDVMSAGTNVIIVSAGNWTSGGVRLGMGSSNRLNADDADAIRRQVPGVAFMAPGVRTRQQIISGGENWSATIEGTGPDLPAIRSWPMEAGRFFGPLEVASAAKVAVIGSIVRDVLFGPGVNPVGRLVRIGSQPFAIIGLLATKGQTSTGEDQDDVAFVPYTTAQKKLMGVTYVRNITISAVSADRVRQVAEDVAAVLRIRHEIAPGEPDDFRVRTLEDIVELRTRTTRTMTTLLAAVAIVSLLVGGLGIMNIMLVSVTERTREIGLRLAVGARSRDVLRQFLMEAILLSLAGGLLGVVLGLLLSKGLTELLAWPTSVSASAIVFSSGFAGAVGVFFGWYPARRAASVDPIDALRFE